VRPATCIFGACVRPCVRERKHSTAHSLRAIHTRVSLHFEKPTGRSDFHVGSVRPRTRVGNILLFDKVRRKEGDRGEDQR